MSARHFYRSLRLDMHLQELGLTLGNGITRTYRNECVRKKFRILSNTQGSEIGLRRYSKMHLTEFGKFFVNCVSLKVVLKIDEGYLLLFLENPTYMIVFPKFPHILYSLSITRENEVRKLPPYQEHHTSNTL
jgi:hypothetical protein